MLSKILLQDVCAILDVLSAAVPGDRGLPSPEQGQAPEYLQPGAGAGAIQGAQEDSGASQGGGGGADSCREEDLPHRSAGG